MSSLRALRRTHALSLFDLAALTGLPARTIAEAEHGWRTLSTNECAIFAQIFGPTNQHLFAPVAPQPVFRLPKPSYQAAAATIAVGVVVLQIVANAPLTVPVSPLLDFAPRGVARPLAAPASSDAALVAAIQVAPAPSPAVEPAQAAPPVVEPAPATGRAVMAPIQPPIPDRGIVEAARVAEPAPAVVAPAFYLGEAGPVGCPLQPTNGRAVVTQGYGVGSHAPANVWGAVDLGVDDDGDGWAEPGPTWNTPVVATHAGRVRVTMNSYPAGNHIWVEDPVSGWRTGYSHLALVFVLDGQMVEPGTQIGLVGSTGMSSGPHLDYQVWQGDDNVDPTALVAGGC